MSWGMPVSLPEVRSGRPYTDLRVQASYDNALGQDSQRLARNLAVVEFCAGLWARSFAAAKPIGVSDAVARSITPSLLGQIGRDLIYRGESIWNIRVRMGIIDLLPAGTWSVIRGAHPDEADWWYWISTATPAATLTTMQPSSAIVHARWAVHTSQTWVGLSPIVLSKTTSDLAGGLEGRLCEEAGAPVGSFIPVPADGGDGDEDEDPLAPLKRDIAAAQGRAVLVETTSAGFGDKAAAPQTDWVSKRFGAHPPVVLDALRTNSESSLCAACGVPVSLMGDAGTAQGAKEAWRRYGMASVAPMLKIVAGEFARKLDAPGLSFDIRSLWSHDQVGRSQSFKMLVASGMPMAEAAAASGILMEDA